MTFQNALKLVSVGCEYTAASWLLSYAAYAQRIIVLFALLDVVLRLLEKFRVHRMAAYEALLLVRIIKIFTKEERSVLRLSFFENTIDYVSFFIRTVQDIERAIRILVIVGWVSCLFLTDYRLVGAHNLCSCLFAAPSIFSLIVWVWICLGNVP